ncbi:Fe-S cluster assembly sulfur transfer protein SufU [Gemmatimonas sp.]
MAEAIAAAASSASIAAMYQEALLAHHRAPHNRRELPDATSRASHKNPVCGDEITVMVKITDGLVVDVAFSGRGCSIATASASMMTDAVRGMPVHDALPVIDAVERMLNGATVELPSVLTPLRGVAPFAGRHGCARMPWQALREALD